MRFNECLAILMAATTGSSFILTSFSSYCIGLSTIVVQTGLVSAYVVPSIESPAKIQVRKRIDVVVRRQDESDTTTSLAASATEDPSASLEPSVTQDSITSADPGATQDPVTSLDPSATQDPVTSIDPTPTAAPTESVNGPDSPVPEPTQGGNSTMPHHCHHPRPGRPPMEWEPYKGNGTHHHCHPHKPGMGGPPGHNGTEPWKPWPGKGHGMGHDATTQVKPEVVRKNRVEAAADVVKHYVRDSLTKRRRFETDSRRKQRAAFVQKKKAEKAEKARVRDLAAEQD